MYTGHLVFAEISRKVRWAVSVQDGGDEEYIQEFAGILEKGHFKDSNIGGKITLRWILTKYSVRK
jgi:hypothetical protein